MVELHLRGMSSSVVESLTWLRIPTLKTDITTKCQAPVSSAWPKRAIQAQRIMAAPGRPCALRQGRRSWPLRSVRVWNKLDNGREDVSSSAKDVEKKEAGLVEKIEGELGRQFGGVLWFSVLLFFLAVFGGGYAYFIFTYADFTDIPILRGPQR